MKFLSEYFGYHPAVLSTVIDDFILDGCVECAAPLTHESRALRISERGHFALARLAGNPEYINLALQTTGLPVSLIEKGSFVIFKADERTLFTKGKIVNGLNFLRLLKDIEGREAEQFNQKIREMKSGVSDYDIFGNGIFRITSTYELNIKKSIAKILERSRSRGKSPLLEQVLNHFEEHDESVH